MRPLLILAGAVPLIAVFWQTPAAAADFSCAVQGQQPISYRLEKGRLINLRENVTFTTIKEGSGYIIAARAARDQNAASVVLINTQAGNFRITAVTSDGGVGSVDGMCRPIDPDPNAGSHRRSGVAPERASPQRR